MIDLNHPYPIQSRKDYEILDGEWEFLYKEIDKLNIETIIKMDEFPNKITVPYTLESKLSGIQDMDDYNTVAYAKNISIKNTDKNPYLIFTGVDYESDLYLNGELIKKHIGGYVPFEVKLNDYDLKENNRIILIVKDDISRGKMRGKQRWKETNHECWYNATIGIWKTVYLEYRGQHEIGKIKVNSNIDGAVTFEGEVLKESHYQLKIMFNDIVVKELSGTVSNDFKIKFSLDNPHLWSNKNPNLYEYDLITNDDLVHGYFGIRKIDTNDKGVWINNKLEYLKMVLVQGYWQDSNMSPQSIEALAYDIQISKKMGFNGIRMHQKIEDFRFYTLCDILGIYVWAELPSAYEYSKEIMDEYQKQSMEILPYLVNNPSTITYVLFNETWGVYEVNHSLEIQKRIIELVDKFRAYDNTRPIISVDGWYHVDSDIISLHEYEQDFQKIAMNYERKDMVLHEDFVVNTFGSALVKGKKYNNQPIMISEYGGVAFVLDKGWGYGEKVLDKNQLYDRIKAITDTITNLDYVTGYCYTQLYDVQQETNGLLDENRNFKLDLEKIYSIFGD